MAKEKTDAKSGAEDQSMNLEENLLEMILQCFELQGEGVEALSLAQLSLMFCRSPFAEKQTFIDDCYGEKLQVWMLSNPLCLRRYLAVFHEVFSINGAWVAKVNKEDNDAKNIPHKIFLSISLLKKIIFGESCGFMTMVSLVEAIKKEVDNSTSSKRQDYRTFGIPISENRVRTLVNACFSLFKLESNGLVEIVSGIGILQDNEPFLEEKYWLTQSEEKSLPFLEQILIKNKRSMPLAKLHLQAMALFEEDSSENRQAALEKTREITKSLMSRKESFQITGELVFLMCSNQDREILQEIKQELKKTWGVSKLRKLAGTLGKSSSGFSSKLRKAIQTWPLETQEKSKSSEECLSFFLSKFPWVFEVKMKSSQNVSEYTVFLLERQDSRNLYKILDLCCKQELSREGKYETITRALSYCVNSLQANKCTLSLHSDSEVLRQSADIKLCAGVYWQDAINFLSVFPELFQISDGAVRLIRSIKEMKDLERDSSASIKSKSTVTESQKSDGSDSTVDTSCSANTCSDNVKQNTIGTDCTQSSVETTQVLDSVDPSGLCTDSKQGNQKQQLSDKVSNIEVEIESETTATDPYTEDLHLACRSEMAPPSSKLEVGCCAESDHERPRQRETFLVEEKIGQVPPVCQVSGALSSDVECVDLRLISTSTSPTPSSSSCNHKCATNGVTEQTLEISVTDQLNVPKCVETKLCGQDGLQTLHYKTNISFGAEIAASPAIENESYLEFEGDFTEFVDYSSWVQMENPWTLTIDSGPVFIDFSQPLNLESGPFVVTSDAKDSVATEQNCEPLPAPGDPSQPMEVS